MATVTMDARDLLHAAEGSALTACAPMRHRALGIASPPDMSMAEA
jgi:hypothetical protein